MEPNPIASMLLLRQRSSSTALPLRRRLTQPLHRPSHLVSTRFPDRLPASTLPICSQLLRIFPARLLCFLTSQVGYVTAACTAFVSRCRELHKQYCLRDLMFLTGRTITFYMIFLVPVVSADGYQCGCANDESIWTMERTVILQQLSGYLSAYSQYSIALVFLWYMIPHRRTIPFKSYFSVVLLFITFSGATQMITAWRLNHQPFEIAFTLLLFKIAITILSFSIKVTLSKCIGLFHRFMTTSFRLNERVRSLHMEMDTITQRNELNFRIWMVNREIRRTLHKETVLRTTLIQLAKALDLENCMIWLPNEENRNMVLSYTLRDDHPRNVCLSFFDPDLRVIREDKKAKILAPTSALGVMSIGMESEVHSVAAIRIVLPLTPDSCFSLPTPIPPSFGVLIVVLPQTHVRVWRYQELEFVEMISEQITVALSHVALIEDSERKRDKLAKRNRALHQARENVENSNNSLKSFQKVWRHQVIIHLQTISGTLSILQQEQMGVQPSIIVSSMLKASSVISALIYENERLNIKTFKLHHMINEALCLTRCLSIYHDLSFESEVKKSLPNWVRGDERRVFREMMSKIGILLSKSSPGGTLYMHVISSSSGDNEVGVKFEIGLTEDDHLNTHVMHKLELIESIASCAITRPFEQPSFDFLLKGIRVALVDQDNRRVMHKLLERCGCKVTSVSSGLQCLEVLGVEGCPFDIVVLELNLQDMDGFTVANIVRQFHSRSRLLIVALTSDRSHEVLERCWDVGIDGVISKPVQLNEIAAGLRRILEYSAYITCEGCRFINGSPILIECRDQTKNSDLTILG